MGSTLCVVPNDIMKIVFEYGEVSSQVNLSLTCKRFYGYPWLESLLKSSILKEFARYSEILLILVQKVKRVTWRSLAVHLSSTLR